MHVEPPTHAHAEHALPQKLGWHASHRAPVQPLLHAQVPLPLSPSKQVPPGPHAHGVQLAPKKPGAHTSQLAPDHPAGQQVEALNALQALSGHTASGPVRGRHLCETRHQPQMFDDPVAQLEQLLNALQKVLPDS
jgi:hypothetical protein